MVKHTQPIRRQFVDELFVCVCDHFVILALKGLITVRTLTIFQFYSLTLNVPYISEGCIEIKIKLNFCFRTSLCCFRRFYEGL